MRLRAATQTTSRITCVLADIGPEFLLELSSEEHWNLPFAFTEHDAIMVAIILNCASRQVDNDSLPG